MTPSRTTSEPGTISAATSGNAAEDGSDGTAIGAPVRVGWPRRAILRPCRPSGSTLTSAPKWRSMRSVWSRVASRSTTVVTPGELRPASSTADLICADAAGVS